MWFKNLVFYRLEAPFGYTPETLEEALAQVPFKPCGSQELSSYGWTSSMGKLSELRVHAGSGFMLICAKKEERVLPASVVRDFVNEKVEVIEEEQMRKVRKKERDEIRDQVMLELTPKAFTRSSLTFALIAPSHDLLIVDASSAKKADELTSHLRKTLGNLSLVIPQVNHAPADLFTRWLAETETPPADLVIGDECELLDPGEDGGIVRCRRQDLASNEIKVHLEAGKQCVKLGLAWDEKLTFMLCDDLSVKKLRYSEALIEQAADAGEAGAAARFDADFTLMSLELSRFVPRLLAILGGVAKQK